MITFIESGNRIATENFETGEIYTITYTNGNYRTMCCIGIGTDFVMFQGTLPNALFCLTLGTSETVSTIELGGGGSGTMNYNELENKPQINGIVLIGNKTASDLNLVSQTELADYATNASVVSALASKQDTLTTTQLTAVNSGITSSLVSQITTNQNNISYCAKVTEIPITGLVDSETIDISTMPSGIYMICTTNTIGAQNPQRYGTSVYMFQIFGNRSIGAWSAIVEIANAKILTYSLNNETLSFNYDATGFHTTKFLSMQ